jgi:Ca2+-binding RTX toxin-like protein
MFTRYGGTGDDILNGQNGTDVLYGGSGNDIISGGNGGDTLYGGSGTENIAGGSGADHIYGGYGADTIDPGGAGGDGDTDTIHYLSLLDTNDTISNFVSGQDKIDLSAIDASSGSPFDQAFAWGGQKTGAIVEAHSVTWYQNGANVVVIADTDSDLSNAEFMITLTGITSIAQSDFNTL